MVSNLPMRNPYNDDENCFNQQNQSFNENQSYQVQNTKKIGLDNNIDEYSKPVQVKVERHGNPTANNINLQKKTTNSNLKTNISNVVASNTVQTTQGKKTNKKLNF